MRGSRVLLTFKNTNVTNTIQSRRVLGWLFLRNSELLASTLRGDCSSTRLASSRPVSASDASTLRSSSALDFSDTALSRFFPAQLTASRRGEVKLLKLIVMKSCVLFVTFNERDQQEEFIDDEFCWQLPATNEFE